MDGRRMKVKDIILIFKGNYDTLWDIDDKKGG